MNLLDRYRLIRESNDTSDTVYHSSPTTNQHNIIKNGLNVENDKTGMGGVFFSNTIPKRSKNFDVWAVKSKHLNLEHDHTGEPEEPEKWYVHYGNVHPKHLTLLDKDAT